jgi:hypothetical protein
MNETLDGDINFSGSPIPPPNVDNIPPQLKSRKIWVLHKDKVPFQVNGAPAKTNDSQTWNFLVDVLKAYIENPNKYDGIGFAMDGSIGGIDLDHCFNDDGTIEPWASFFLEAMGKLTNNLFYAEKSPSGKGLHIVFLIDKVRDDVVYDIGDKKHVEFRFKGRYFTYTGDVYEGHDKLTAIRIDDLNEIIGEFEHTFFDALSKEAQRRIRNKHAVTETNNGFKEPSVPIKTLVEYYGQTYASLRNMNGRTSKNEVIGEHPIHGSTTGRNFTIDFDKNVWHCFRHGHGGGINSLIAIMEGIVRCEEWHPNYFDEHPDVLVKVREIKAKKFNVKTKEGQEGPRELKADEIKRIVELLDEAYRGEYRQDIAVNLAGMLAKGGIHIVSSAELFKALMDEDGEEREHRIRALLNAYRENGWRIEDYKDKINGILGTDVSGLISDHYDHSEAQRGLLDTLSASVDAVKASTIIMELNEILRTISPFKGDIVSVKIEDAKSIYAVAYFNNKVLAKVKRSVDGDTGEVKYITVTKVAFGVPDQIKVIEDKLTGERKLRVKWVDTVGEKWYEGTIDDIASAIRRTSFVTKENAFKDVFSAIIDTMIKKGRAEVIKGYTRPGIYAEENGDVIASNVKIADGNEIQELKDALLLLNDIASYQKHKEKFATAIRWFVPSPFIFASKQRGKTVKWLYLYGTSNAGKTTIADIGLSLFRGCTNTLLEPLDFKHKGGAVVSSEYRLGKRLNTSTFPTVLNEPKGIFENPKLVEMIKSAYEDLEAREAGDTKYLALSPLVFTSNTYIQMDGALRRRLLTIKFSLSDVQDADKIREFNQKVKPRLGSLGIIGQFIVKTYLERGAKILDEYNYDEEAKAILTELYETAGLEVPDWVSMTYNEDEEEVDVVNLFRGFLHSYFINAKRQSQELFQNNTTLSEIIVQLLMFNRTNHVALQRKRGANDAENVVVFAEIQYDQLYPKELRQLAFSEIVEKMGQRYGNVYAGNRQGKGMKMPLKDFIQFVAGEEATVNPTP